MLFCNIIYTLFIKITYMSTKDDFLKVYYLLGDNMRVKVFDEMHEKDLENSVNDFLNEIGDNVIDIKYQVAISMFAEEQIYCFSAMILYKIEE